MHHPMARRARWGFAALALCALPASAADHNEAPGTKADGSADIDDLYAWHTGDGKLITILTFGGPGGDPAAPPDAYDADLLYGIHIDTDGDLASDHDVWVRFGQNDAGDWGVQFEGVPGGSGTVSGPVETAIDVSSDLKAQAGVFDDPFFFDLTGFTDTLATGTVAFDTTRDAFAGKNVNAIVVEMDAAAATDGNPVRIWATTGRK